MKKKVKVSGHFLRPTNRTKLLTRKLFAFKWNQECVTISKEKGKIILRHGTYRFLPLSFFIKGFDSMPLAQKVLLLDTRYGLSTVEKITLDKISIDSDLTELKVAEVDEVKKQFDDLVKKHIDYLKIINNFPKVPKDY